MGVYIKLRERRRRQKVLSGFPIFKKFLSSAEKSGIFVSESIIIWEGYPLQSLGKKIRHYDNISSINTRDIFQIKENYSIMRTIQVEGILKLSNDLDIGAYMMFSGDEISLDLPDIYLESYSYQGKDLIDFMRGANNPERKRIMSWLNSFYKALVKKEDEQILLFIGESPDCVDLFHKAMYLRFHNDYEYYKQFINYAIRLRKKSTDRDWLRIKQKEIEEMYERISYLKTSFLPETLVRSEIKPYDTKNTLSEFLKGRMGLTAELQVGSLIIADKEFSGESVQALLNELLIDLAEVIEQTFSPKAKLEKQFASEFEKKIRKWQKENIKSK